MNVWTDFLCDKTSRISLIITVPNLQFIFQLGQICFEIQSYWSKNIYYYGTKDFGKVFKNLIIHQLEKIILLVQIYLLLSFWLNQNVLLSSDNISRNTGM